MLFLSTNLLLPLNSNPAMSIDLKSIEACSEAPVLTRNQVCPMYSGACFSPVTRMIRLDKDGKTITLLAHTPGQVEQ